MSKKGFSLSNIKIALKLPLLLIFLAIVNSAILAYVAVNAQMKDALHAVEYEIEVVTESRKANMETYLNSLTQDLLSLSNSLGTQMAVRDFTQAWDALEGDQTKILQQLYIMDNPNALGEKHLLDYAEDGSLYSQVHARFHDTFRTFLTQKGYYDIFLFAPNGDLVYSVFKELDYATNLNTGEWKDSDLGNAFRAGMESEAGDISFFDFKPYAPSYDAPASFMSTPIVRNGQTLGVLVFQMPIDNINSIMSFPSGLGETGKSQMFGADYLARSNNRFDTENQILVTKNDSVAIREALAGKKGVGQSDGKVYAYDYLDFYGTRWAIATDKDLSEALASAYTTKQNLILISIAIVLVLAVMGVLFARSISKPLQVMTSVMRKLADNDFSVSVPYQGRGDEVGDIASSVEVFKENGMQMEAMQEEQEKLKAKAEIDKKEAALKLANDFEASVAESIESLGGSSASLSAMAVQMSKSSDDTLSISGQVAAAAVEADTNVQTVAAAAEELAASSDEIARQVEDVARVASQAASDAEVTSASVNQLNELADSIGEVVGAIKDIAEQTNLLALNATIEAARAGEAGKGFAVVADEVKKLANETASKTEQIDERVGAIQTAIRNSVSAVEAIIGNVKKIDEATTSVASAVEEQNAATGEIGRSVSEASIGTQQVSSSIVEVERNASETKTASEAVLGASNEMGELSKSLRAQVDSFLDTIRNS